MTFRHTAIQWLQGISKQYLSNNGVDMCRYLLSGEESPEGVHRCLLMCGGIDVEQYLSMQHVTETP